MNYRHFRYKKLIYKALNFEHTQWETVVTPKLSHSQPVLTFVSFESNNSRCLFFTKCSLKRTDGVGRVINRRCRSFSCLLQIFLFSLRSVNESSPRCS